MHNSQILLNISPELINYVKFKKITTKTINLYEIMACLVVEKDEKFAIDNIKNVVNLVTHKPVEYYELLKNNELKTTNISKISILALIYQNNKTTVDYTYLISLYGGKKVYKRFSNNDSFIQICKYLCSNI